MSGVIARKTINRGPKDNYVCPHSERMDKMEERLEALEGVYNDIEEVKKIVKQIWGAIKWGAPSIITAAVTAGYVNGSFAVMLKAIFN